MESNTNVIWFPDSLIAWERINEAFLKNEEDLGAEYKGRALYAYDLVIGVVKPVLDPTFDFGRHFNYTDSKWKTLVGNYIDYESLDIAKKEVAREEKKGNKVYNVALQFNNKHGHGKSCLLSMVFSRRANKKVPYIVVFLRASETTKRLACDLLLFQRIGEYIYEDTKFQLIIHFNQIFNDDTVLLMYHAHKDIERLLKKAGNDRAKELSKRLKYLLQCDPSEIKYKVHKRGLKVLGPDLFKYPKTLAKDCQL